MISPLRDQWRKASKRYRNRGGFGPFQIIARHELRMASKLYDFNCVQPDGWVLDFGSGSGGIWLFSSPPQKLIALDIVPVLAPTSTYSYRITGDAGHPPFREGEVSAILALGLLEYLTDLDSVFSTWRKISKEGAILIVTNSPPTLPNKLRKWLGLKAIPRPDSMVEEALIRQNWRILNGSHHRAGWQTFFVAEAGLVTRTT